MNHLSILPLSLYAVPQVPVRDFRGFCKGLKIFCVGYRGRCVGSGRVGTPAPRAPQSLSFRSLLMTHELLISTSALWLCCLPCTWAHRSINHNLNSPHSPRGSPSRILPAAALLGSVKTEEQATVQPWRQCSDPPGAPWLPRGRQSLMTNI